MAANPGLRRRSGDSSQHLAADAERRAEHGASRFSVGLDRFDPQTVQAMSVAAQERKDETLARLVSAEQRAQSSSRVQRPAGLRERLAHDDLRVVADSLLHLGVAL